MINALLRIAVYAALGAGALWLFLPWRYA